MSPDFDLKLIELAQAGDSRAFEQFWRRHERKAYAVVCSRLHYGEAVSEVTHQIYMQACRLLGQFNGHGSFPNWLCQIADQAASRCLRRQLVQPAERVHKAGVPAAGSPLANPRVADLMARAEATVKSLEAFDQEIIRLVCQERRSPAQVADRLGVTFEDVYEAVKLFRRKLQPRA